MDSSNLLELLKRSIDPDKCCVGGVFPRDYLSIDSFTKFPTCCIVNTDISSKPGQHWVAYYLNSPSDYEFFDSFGLTPAHYQFKLNFPEKLNSTSFQSDFSNTCGQFCLYYLHQKSLGFSLNDIITSFSKLNLRWNDKLVRKFLSRISNRKSFLTNPNITSPRIQISRAKSLTHRLY